MRGLIGLIEVSPIHAALDRRLERHRPAPIALALSGGSDSLALLHMARGWAEVAGRPLIVLTVDHGLHPESAAWTRFAGDAARTAGAAWQALEWRGQKPAAGLPAAARAARHRLLADAARDAGAAVILLGHTADDVAEGELMRTDAAPGIGALREWAPSPVWPEGRGIFLLRPLLNVRRATLRAWLRERDLAWLDDPANQDMRYARPRARSALAASIPLHQGVKPASAGDADASVLAQATQATADGRLILPRAVLEQADPAAARRFLSRALICASGQTTPPRRDALERLSTRLQSNLNAVAGLAGARVVADAVRVTFAREQGEMRRTPLAPLPIGAGFSADWDGRFEVAAKVDVVVLPLAGSAARLGRADRARLAEIPAAARPALPVLVQGDGVSLPHPFGGGPGSARPLAGGRLAAACGLISHERDISPLDPIRGMAQARQSSYVEALALA